MCSYKNNLISIKTHTLNFRMIKPTEKFNFSEPIHITTKLDLIRLSVYNSVFNLNRRNNPFLYASTVLDDGEALAKSLFSSNNTDPNITSVLDYFYKRIPLLYSTVTPGALN